MPEPLPMPAWMGGVDESQVGFPMTLDRSRYTKEVGIAYKQTPLGPQLLDAYLPTEKGPHPLVVMIHGGAWSAGGRYQMGVSRWAGYLASGGLTVVSIDYRLAPETHYPEPFQDCLDAVDWAIDHADELGCDANRLGLWGDSAGGHLALLLATSQTNPAFRGPRMRDGRPRPRAVVAWYPPTDLLHLHRVAQKGTTPRIVEDFIGVAPGTDPVRWQEASPLEQVHTGMPPVLLLHGTRDFLVPYSQSVRFSERLGEIGVLHEFHLVEGALHGFDRIAPDDKTRALIERSREFLCQHLLC